MNTQQKIRFLRKQGKTFYKKIKKKDPYNIVGFRIDKKKTAGVENKSYAFVFHVVNKIDKEKLNGKKIIPETVNIMFPDKIERRIKTDVEQTGKFKLHAGIGGRVKSNLSPSSSFGSAALFVTDDEVRTLMITNYHVVAENLIANGRNYYLRNPANNTLNVFLRLTTGQTISGFLEEGRIARDIDVAFVVFPAINPSENLNKLANGVGVQGRVASNPIPESFRNRIVNIFPVHNPQGIRTRIIDVSTSAGDGNSHYEDLIAMDLVTIGGDSGSIVLTASFLALGIIIGGDDRFSYAIPFYKIENFKSCRIL